MFLGKVITDGKAVGVIDIIERVGLDYKIDKETPTLIIGKKRAEEIYGKNRIKVLDKNIEGCVYWTYAKNERRDEYTSGVKAFNDMVFNTIKNTIKYKYIDVFNTDRKTIKWFIEYMRNTKPKVIYLYKSHLYMYAEKSVYGLDLRECEYLGIKREKIIKLLQTFNNTTLFSNTQFISDSFVDFIGKYRYLIPYLYFLSK